MFQKWNLRLTTNCKMVTFWAFSLFPHNVTSFLWQNVFDPGLFTLHHTYLLPSSCLHLEISSHHYFFLSAPVHSGISVNMSVWLIEAEISESKKLHQHHHLFLSRVFVCWHLCFYVIWYYFEVIGLTGRSSFLLITVWAISQKWGLSLTGFNHSIVTVNLGCSMCTIIKQRTPNLLHF